MNPLSLIMMESSHYDELDIDLLEYHEERQIYYYPCSCGDQYEVTEKEFMEGEEFASCPTCTLVLRVIDDPDKFKVKDDDHMSDYQDEMTIEDFEYNDENEMFYYPCSCGNQYEVTKIELMEGEEFATCPNCTLTLKVLDYPMS